MFETLKQWDRDLFVFLNNLGIEGYDSFWIAVTKTTTWIPLFIFFVILFLHYYKGKERWVVFFYFLVMLAAVFSLTGLVKHFVARLRPSETEALADLIRILQRPSNYSFFSGHASSSFAITTYVVLSIRKFSVWIYFSFLWPVLFVLSRIYVGVHYPSDILVGMVVGVSLATVAYVRCDHTLKHPKPLPVRE